MLWEHKLPAGGYATPSVYMTNGKQYVAIAAGGSGKNGTKAGDSIIGFALPDGDDRRESDSDWIQLFDGKTLNGWFHRNGAHTFVAEDGAIAGRTVESSPSTGMLYGDAGVGITGSQPLIVKFRNLRVQALSASQ